MVKSEKYPLSEKKIVAQKVVTQWFVSMIYRVLLFVRYSYKDCWYREKKAIQRAKMY